MNTWNKTELKRTKLLDILNDIIRESTKLKNEMQTKQKSTTYDEFGMLMTRLGKELAGAGKDVQAIKEEKQKIKPGELPWRIKWQDQYGDMHTTTCYGKTSKDAEKQFKVQKLNYVKHAADQNGGAFKETVRYKIINTVPGVM